MMTPISISVHNGLSMDGDWVSIPRRGAHFQPQQTRHSFLDTLTAQVSRRTLALEPVLSMMTKTLSHSLFFSHGIPSRYIGAGGWYNGYIYNLRSVQRRVLAASPGVAPDIHACVACVAFAFSPASSIWRVALRKEELALLESMPSGVRSIELVLHWALDQSNGNTVIDRSGQGRTGTAGSTSNGFIFPIYRTLLPALQQSTLALYPPEAGAGAAGRIDALTHPINRRHYAVVFSGRQKVDGGSQPGQHI